MQLPLGSDWLKLAIPRDGQGFTITKHIIAIVTSVVLSLCFITAMVLVTRFLVHKHDKNTPNKGTYTADGCTERQRQLENISNSWKRLFTPKQDQGRGPWVPNLSGIIKAGDEGLFSSTLFTTLPGHSGEISLDGLYEAFSRALRTAPMTERPVYSAEVFKFLSGTKRGAGGLGRTKSLSLRATSGRRVDMDLKTQRMSLDLSTAERGLAKDMTIKKSTPAFLPMHNGLHHGESPTTAHGSWMKDGQIAEYQDGRMSVGITPAELAALSIILGSPLNIGAESEDASLTKGAFGISMSSSSKENGITQITLQQHKHPRSQQYAQSSGFSTLFAKHLATGSLPYSQDKNTVNSILITNATFEAVQAGASLYIRPSTARTSQSEFLSSLPSSCELSFHILAASAEAHSSTKLIDTIASLPFAGGLPPLASTPLVKTIQFVACGGLSPGRLLQRLEGLVDKVHQHNSQTKLFGPLYELQNAGLLYRERERLGKLATTPNTTDALTDKAARMSRYIALLQRLMALVPGIKSQDAIIAVQQATKTELQRSYTDAVTAYANTESETRGERISNASRASARRSNCSSTLSTQPINSVASPTSSTEFPVQNLGQQIEQVLKADLPLSLETVAFVARMVIVAWTLSVEIVAWEEGEKGFKVPDFESLPEKMVLR